MKTSKIEEAIQQLFIEQTWTLGVAESCTGGAIAACLVKNPGASQYFLGGIVAYSNQLKEKLLQVNKETLTQKGAVSQETIQEMALGAIDSLECDFAVAVSGITGPSGGTSKNPVGTVWIAIAKKGEDIGCYKLSGTFEDRQTIIEESVHFALEALYRFALKHKNTKTELLSGF